MQYLVCGDDALFYIRQLKSLQLNNTAAANVGSRVSFYEPENVSRRRQKIMNGVILKYSKSEKVLKKEMERIVVQRNKAEIKKQKGDEKLQNKKKIQPSKKVKKNTGRKNTLENLNYLLKNKPTWRSHLPVVSQTPKQKESTVNSQTAVELRKLLLDSLQPTLLTALSNVKSMIDLLSEDSVTNNAIEKNTSILSAQGNLHSPRTPNFWSLASQHHQVSNLNNNHFQSDAPQISSVELLQHKSSNHNYSSQARKQYGKPTIASLTFTRSRHSPATIDQRLYDFPSSKNFPRSPTSRSHLNSLLNSRSPAISSHSCTLKSQERTTKNDDNYLVHQKLGYTKTNTILPSTITRFNDLSVSNDAHFRDFPARTSIQSQHLTEIWSPRCSPLQFSPQINGSVPQQTSFAVSPRNTLNNNDYSHVQTHRQQTTAIAPSTIIRPSRSQVSRDPRTRHVSSQREFQSPEIQNSKSLVSHQYQFSSSDNRSHSIFPQTSSATSQQNTLLNDDHLLFKSRKQQFKSTLESSEQNYSSRFPVPHGNLIANSLEFQDSLSNTTHERQISPNYNRFQSIPSLTVSKTSHQRTTPNNMDFSPTQKRQSRLTTTSKPPTVSHRSRSPLSSSERIQHSHKRRNFQYSSVKEKYWSPKSHLNKFSSRCRRSLQFEDTPRSHCSADDYQLSPSLQPRPTTNSTQLPVSQETASNQKHRSAPENKLTTNNESNTIRWTLRYQEANYESPDVRELIPGSRIFVNLQGLENLKSTAYDLRSFARGLLVLIFSSNALKNCTLTDSTRGKGKTDNNEPRKPLDAHGLKILMDYLEKYRKEKGWKKLDDQTIKQSLRNKLIESR